MSSFASASARSDLIAALLQEVTLADAGFQVAQQRDWNRLGGSHVLLAGYDRLANLGLDEVSVTFALVLVRPGWLRRLRDRRLGDAREPRYRLATAKDRATLQMTLTVRRDPTGRWTTMPSREDEEREALG